MVILDNDMKYGLMIWEMAISIWSSPMSIWDISSLWMHSLVATRGGCGLRPPARVEHRGGIVTRCDPISIWEIDMGDRHGTSDVNDISIRISIWDMCY
jgi:hypothetical protein